MRMSVCLLVCLSDYRTVPIFVHVACGRGSVLVVARSSSDGAAIRYVLLVLRMASCSHTMGPMDRIKHDIMFRSSPGGSTSWTSNNYTVFG